MHALYTLLYGKTSTLTKPIYDSWHNDLVTCKKLVSKFQKVNEQRLFAFARFALLRKKSKKLTTYLSKTATPLLQQI